MEKQRCVKMDEIMKNMLIIALRDLFREERKKNLPFEESGKLVLKLEACDDKRLFLSDSEYRKVKEALNLLRNSFIAKGRYTDGIDVVLLKILRAKYKKCAIR